MNPFNYLHLQMQLEGKEIFNECRIRQVEVVPDEELPLMLIAQLVSQESLVYFGETILHDLQKKLNATSIDFPNVDPLLDILKLHNIPFEIGHYKTYMFPLQPIKDADVKCLSKHDSKVKAFGFDGFAEQVYAIECNESIISACVSTRENEKCGEAWVYTTPECRKRGFAQKVVNAWARDLIGAGKVPFYSHRIENMASASLARKLDLQAVFEEICITQI
ncbi:MAG TPA: GNAT family N-acetyltransferase [Anaerolineales bacterium]|nr:GNAT family N-acetyltransferase [Anaerolineales bacterium]